MPRSLKVVITCNNCDTLIAAGEGHKGDLVLTINGVGPKQLDLCRACFDGGDLAISPGTLLRLFEDADLIPEAKPSPRRTSRNTNQSQPSPCPACSHVAGSPQGLGRHARTVHGMTVAELRKEIEEAGA